MHSLALGLLSGPSLSAPLTLSLAGTCPPAPPTWNWMSLFFLQVLALGVFTSWGPSFLLLSQAMPDKVPRAAGTWGSQEQFIQGEFSKKPLLKSALPRPRAKPTGLISFYILESGGRRGLQIRLRYREGWDYKRQAGSSKNLAQIELGKIP